ncbi:pyridoxamine 5'-phosphate oxidase family protein [Microlunatus speluncae]|uniref:pyridoxamine 5'-phosphate oxidase family protein n=1 Tax=Microlunatus speluncae TaxID=2594267 RepID=UPI0012665D65|nr:nitroreductase/quinone reductase family protein [Microlunatus speluncae]
MDAIDPELTDRLRRDRTAWLCTLRANGSPHLTPVWFVHRDDRFWISSGERNVKVRNVVADPRVSLALEDGDAPYVAEGRVVVHRDRLRADVLRDITAKYDGWDSTVEIPPYGPRVLLEVTVDRWLLRGRAQ